MKLFKSILATILTILLIPVQIIMTTGILTYLIPQIRTVLEINILHISLSNPALLWITIASSAIFLIAIIVQSIIGKDLSAKYKNALLHINTWTIALTAVAVVITTFILINPLVTTPVMFTLPKKIGMAVIIGLLVTFHIFSGKLLSIINRKIQAYETAKELNTIGRSSIIFVNILKLFEIFFPEILLISLICLSLSWNVSVYFIVILVASILPVIGNIVCDFNTRKDIRTKKEIENDLLAKKIAKNIKK